MTCNNPTDHICRKSKVAGSRTVAVLFRQFTRANQCKFGPIIRTSWGKYEIKVSFRFLAARRPSSILHFNPTIMHRSKPGFKLAWNSLLNGIVQGKHRSSPKLPPCTQPPKLHGWEIIQKHMIGRVWAAIAVLITQFNFPDFEAPTQLCSDGITCG